METCTRNYNLTLRTTDFSQAFDCNQTCCYCSTLKTFYSYTLFNVYLIILTFSDFITTFIMRDLKVLINVWVVLSSSTTITVNHRSDDTYPTAGLEVTYNHSLNESENNRKSFLSTAHLPSACCSISSKDFSSLSSFSERSVAWEHTQTPDLTWSVTV